MRIESKTKGFMRAGSMVKCGAVLGALAAPMMAVGQSVAGPTPEVLIPQVGRLGTCEKVSFKNSKIVNGQWMLSYSLASGPGSITPEGAYAAPPTRARVGATPFSVTVSATPNGDEAISHTPGSETFTVDTAFPTTTPIPISPAMSSTQSPLPNVPYTSWQHAIAARGSRAYAVWVGGAGTSAPPNVYLAYSLDGAKTWSTPMVISTVGGATVGAGTKAPAANPTVAIDAADPSTVYVAHTESTSASMGFVAVVTTVAGLGGTATPAPDKRVAFSYDRYTPVFLDVASPAANTVVIEGREPVVAGTYRVAGDSQRGHCWPTAASFNTSNPGAFTPPAGCATESWTSSPQPTSCSGATQAACSANAACGWKPIVPAPATGPQGSCLPERSMEQARIALAEGVGATPRICMVWKTDNNVTGTYKLLVNCSADAGRSWGPSSAYASSTAEPTKPVIALSGSGKAAIAYYQGAKVYVMTSQDAGATFAGPVSYTVPNVALGPNTDLRFTPNGALWIATETYPNAGVYVDKTCDATANPTWSGAVRVNDASARAAYPMLINLGNEPAFAVQWTASGAAFNGFRLF
jgi:hypothetical protein